MMLVDKHIRYFSDNYFIGILNIVMRYENSDKFLLFLFFFSPANKTNSTSGFDILL